MAEDYTVEKSSRCLAIARILGFGLGLPSVAWHLVERVEQKLDSTKQTFATQVEDDANGD